MALGIYFNPGSTRLRIYIASSTDRYNYFDSTKELPLHIMTSVRLEAVGREIRLFLNNSLDSTKTLYTDRITGSAYLYTSAQWDPLALAIIGSKPNCKSNLPLITLLVQNNLIENGSFEKHAADCLDLHCTSTKAYLISPWVSLSSTGDFEIDRGWPAADGIWSMDLSTWQPVTIQQDIKAAVPGTNYVLSFKLNANRGGPYSVKTGWVQVLGEPKQTFSYDSSSSSQWETVIYRFTAPMNGSILQIGSTVNDYRGPVIDAFELYSEGIQLLPISTFSTLAATPASPKLVTVPADYSLAFELVPTGKVSGWGMILHYSKDKSNESRVPGKR